MKKLRLGKRLVIIVIGFVSYPFLAMFNKVKVEGMEHLQNLPKQNVLFLGNHQTYFAEVIAMLHVFSAVKWGRKRKLGFPWYLLSPVYHVYFVSAAETMKKTWLTRLFAAAGSIMVKRTWNEGSTEVRSGLDASDTRKIFKALETSWVINFPQGTTKAFAPGRKGSVLLIKRSNPIVIPVVVDGFNTAFDKKGIKMVKKGSVLSLKFKAPLQIDLNASADSILEQIMDSIEQSEKYSS